MTNLQKVQRNIISNIFNPESALYHWSILIYDDVTQRIVATLYKLGVLRNFNITLHQSINQNRQRVPFIRAIYFIQNNQQNIERLKQDQDLYDEIQVHFTSEINELTLNELKYLPITQIDIIYCQYQCIFPDFITGINNNREKLNQNLLLQVAYSMKKKIDFPNWDQQYEWQEQAENLQFQQIKREVDESVILTHCWEYGALIQDLIGIIDNKIILEIENKRVEYDLDTDSDPFWEKSRLLPFPYVAEDIEKELITWKNDYDQMGHRKNDQTVNLFNKEDMSLKLTSALDKIPEMTDRKKKIDMHTNIATYLMNQIKDRSLDQFFELEQTLMNNHQLSLQEKEQFDYLMSLQNEFDKARLLSIRLQCESKQLRIGDQTIQQKGDIRLQYQFQNNKINIFLQHILNGLKNQSNKFQNHSKPKNAQQQNLLSNLTETFKQTKISSQLQQFSNKILKTLQLKSRINFKINEILQNMVQNQQTQETNQQEIAIYCQDFGSFNEYVVIQEWSKKNQKNVLYLCEKVLNAEQYIELIGKIN